MMKRRRRKKKRLRATSNAELLSYGCPEKSTQVFSLTTYRASARKSVPTERAASSAKELFWGIGDLPNKQFCRAKMQSVYHSALLASFVSPCSWLFKNAKNEGHLRILRSSKVILLLCYFQNRFFSESIHVSIASAKINCCLKTAIPVSGISGTFSFSRIFSSR